MFNLFEYIDQLLPDVPAIGKVYPVTSIVQIETILSDLRNVPKVAALVRESPSGQLNFDERRLDTSYEMFYVMVRSSVNDHASRLFAKRQAKSIGIQLIDRMRSDKQGYGSPFYGFRPGSVQYDELGPIAQNYFGYAFTFSIDQGFTPVHAVPDADLIATLTVGVSPNEVGYGYDSQWFGALAPSSISSTSINILAFSTNGNNLMINAIGLFAGKDQGAEVVKLNWNQSEAVLKKTSDNSASVPLMENPFDQIGQNIQVYITLL